MCRHVLAGPDGGGKGKGQMGALQTGEAGGGCRSAGHRIAALGRPQRQGWLAFKRQSVRGGVFRVEGHKHAVGRGAWQEGKLTNAGQQRGRGKRQRGWGGSMKSTKRQERLEKRNSTKRNWGRMKTHGQGQKGREGVSSTRTPLNQRTPKETCGGWQGQGRSPPRRLTRRGSEGSREEIVEGVMQQGGTLVGRGALWRAVQRSAAGSRPGGRRAI